MFISPIHTPAGRWDSTVIDPATRDGGEHWQLQSSGTDKDLGGVYFTHPRTGWAVGERGTIVTTRDGGEHWQPQTSNADNYDPSLFGVHNSLLGVYFADARTGWTVGEGGTILATRDRGEHWQARNSGTARRYGAFISPIRASAGRWDSTERSWRHATAASTGNSKAAAHTRGWLGVYFADARIGWAVGFDGTIRATRDGGEHGHLESSGTDKGLAGVYFADARTGWAVGSGGTILATRDGGAHWQSQSSGTDKGLLGVYFADVRTGWAVGEGGAV